MMEGKGNTHSIQQDAPARLAPSAWCACQSEGSIHVVVHSTSAYPPAILPGSMAAPLPATASTAATPSVTTRLHPRARERVCWHHHVQPGSPAARTSWEPQPLRQRDELPLAVRRSDVMETICFQRTAHRRRCNRSLWPHRCSGLCQLLFAQGGDDARRVLRTRCG